MTRTHTVGRVLACALVALAPACATVDGAPRPARERLLSGADAQGIGLAIKEACFSLKPPEGTADEQKSRRNRMVLAYMLVVDENHSDFALSLLNDARSSGFGATVASLGVATLGGIVTDGSLSRALSAANTGIIGTREAFSKEYLLNQTIAVLQTQMQASRAAVRKVIYERLPLPVTDWDPCLALQDVTNYERAGTLVSAIVSANATAAAAQRANEAEAAAAIPRIAYATDDVVKALRAYFSPADAAVAADRMARAKSDALAVAGLRVPDTITVDEYFGRLLSDRALAAEQRALALGIVQTEADAGAKAPLVAALSN